MIEDQIKEFMPGIDENQVISMKSLLIEIFNFKHSVQIFDARKSNELDIIALSAILKCMKHQSRCSLANFRPGKLIISPSLVLFEEFSRVVVFISRISTNKRYRTGKF